MTNMNSYLSFENLELALEHYFMSFCIYTPSQIQIKTQDRNIIETCFFCQTLQALRPRGYVRHAARKKLQTVLNFAESFEIPRSAPDV